MSVRVGWSARDVVASRPGSTSSATATLCRSSCNFELPLQDHHAMMATVIACKACIRFGRIQRNVKFGSSISMCSSLSSKAVARIIKATQVGGVDMFEYLAWQCRLGAPIQLPCSSHPQIYTISITSRCLKVLERVLQAKANVMLFGFTRFVHLLRYTEIEFLTNGRDALPLVVLPASLKTPASLNRSCVSERLPLQ
jgi:hypothetical protein